MSNEDPQPSTDAASPIAAAADRRTAPDADLRSAADVVLARLVGAPAGGARLREDQWRAIEALVADKRRALVVQRTGWGKSAVYFVATALLREMGAGPTVIRFTAPRTHAQPSGGGRTRGDPREDHQLLQHKGVGNDPGRGGRE